MTQRMTLAEKAEAIIRERHGFIRTAEAQQLGIPLSILQRMARANVLVRETRGLYRLADLDPISNPDWTFVASKNPRAVFCLTSALYFHTLTTQIPHVVYFALPKGAWRPRIDWPPTQVVFMSPASYQAGIETHTIDNLSVKVYSKEKTVADCFKFRNTIGEDIAVEALQDYLRHRPRDIPALTKYAQINRVYRVMRPYIQGAL